jgi:hypothetical protein
MLIKAKNKLLNFVFLTPKKLKMENKLKKLHIIKYIILFNKFPKYEIISLTFGISKVV